MFYFDNSAKVAEYNEVTPLSNYVTIYDNGGCIWEPRYELSISQCTIDETWFPFDEQICKLVFQSWLVPVEQVNYFPIDSDLDDQKAYIESDEWELKGT